MLSKMKSHGNKASNKLKAACSSFVTKVHSGHKSRKQQKVRKCVLDLLQLYDPEKCENIESLMIEWKNREMQLLQHLHQEYHLTDVGLTYFKSKYSRLFELPSIYKGTFCRQCIRRSNGEQRLYHRLYKKRVTPYAIKQIKHSIHIMRALNTSPHIIKLYDIFESRTRLVLITDLFDYGKCSLPIALLNSYKTRNLLLNESIIANLFSQMLDIMAYIHSKNYIHCNLNIDSFIIENWSDHMAISTTRNIPFLKLIRVDSCLYIPELSSAPVPTQLNPRYAAPEMIQFTRDTISTKSDMWSLGILLYVMLTGMLPKQIPMIRCSNQQIVEMEYELKLDHNKQAWNHLSFHARDLINKLIQQAPAKRLSMERCLAHPWMTRYNAGYLQYNGLWEGYESNLKQYQCVQKIRGGIKKLLLIKDCLGLMDNYILTNDVRMVINHWSTQFEQQSVYQLQCIVPSHIKELIVDFA
eukprot:134214_1